MVAPATSHLDTSRTTVPPELLRGGGVTHERSDKLTAFILDSLHARATTPDESRCNAEGLSASVDRANVGDGRHGVPIPAAGCELFRPVSVDNGVIERS